MRFLTFLFTFQTIILICEITNVFGQRSIYDYGVARYRRQKKSKSQRTPLRADEYYASPNLIDPPEIKPNSYYNRMPENKNSAPDGVNSKRLLIDPTESSRTFHHHHSHHSHHGLHNHHSHHGLLGHHSNNRNPKRRRPQYAAQTSPCYYRNARSARSGSSSAPQGRFLWDLNLYNIIPGTQAQYDADCNDYADGNYYGDNGGSSQHSELLNSYLLNLAGYGARPQNRPPYRPLPSGGLIPNSLPGLSNPGLGITPTDSGIGSNSVNQNPDIYDPVYDDRPAFENQFAAPIPQQPQVNGGPNLTPGQIVGGIAQTVNGVIQTLSGNTQQGQFLRTIYDRNYRMRRYRN